MWAIACRRILIALAAGAFLGVPSLFAQESKTDSAKKPEPLAEDYEKTAVQALALEIGAGEPIAAIGVHLLAGEHPKLAPWRLPDAENFWIKNAGLEVRAALAMIGSRSHVGVLAVRFLAADEFRPLGMEHWQFRFDEPLPIPSEYLSVIKDSRPLPVIMIKTQRRPDEPLPEFHEKRGSDWGWYMAYNDALRHSGDATMEMFKKGAKEHENVHQHNLKATPEFYRGKIITVTGKLVVIRKEAAPRFVSLKEIPHIYTGYIVGPTKGAPPFAVAFTELPEGVEKPAENLDLEVTFHGYFLSFVAFPPDRKRDKSQKDVISPYLVGKTPIVNSAPAKKKETTPDDDDGLSSTTQVLVLCTLGGIACICLVIAFLNVWLRRSDRNIRSQLEAMRERDRPFNLEPADPEPATATMDAEVKPPDDPASAPAP